MKHLNLPFYEGDFERKKRGIRIIRPRGDRRQFSDIQIFNLEGIKSGFKKDKEMFKDFFDPNFIFKIKLNQNVDEEEFIKFLERNKIKVISSSPVGKGYWISLAEDENLTEIKTKLKEYGEKDRYKQFDAIESFEPIPPEEKIGEQLKENPLREGEEAYLDIEIWRMEDERLKEFLDGFKRLISSRGGKVTDELRTENLCLLRVKMNRSIFEEIIKLREISRIDRPPKPYITYKMLSGPLEEFEIGGSPPEDAPAIVVLDSGVLSNHPLLEKAVGDEIAVPMLNREEIKDDKPQDDVGHGTEVAGIALYGDIKKCIKEGRFNPEVWILSAKIMFKEEDETTGDIIATYDESELLEHQLEKGVRYFVEKYRNCKVVNISFGDEYKTMFGNRRQFALATLIDELAKELDIIFVVSAGNNLVPHDYGFPENYPHYLIKEKADVKIIDPASSAYAITVGAIAQEFGPYSERPGRILFSPAKTNYPSPFTRVGPGYKGMIKPEIVEEGGNYIYPTDDPLYRKVENIGGGIVVLNHKWSEDGRLFTVSYGTSLSAPKVAHYIAKLFNNFPNYSTNLIKALLIASAEIPHDRPSPLSEISFNDSDKKLMDLLKVYGYGKPNINVALASERNRVLLLAENKIKLDKVHLYYFYLPKEFIEERGEREISVTLVYNPPIRRNRIDYMGASMEFHLFKNAEIQEVLKAYRHIIHSIEESEEVVPEELKVNEIQLRPGVRIRKRGIHQKGTKIYTRRPDIDPNKPLVLAVISQSRWLKDKGYMQDYAVVVTIKHKARIDLYNRIRERIQVRVRTKWSQSRF